VSTWRGKRVSDMSDDEIREMCGAKNVAERYRDAKTCECGALIEEIDGGNSYTYWAHVKAGRIQYDHAAVPVPRSTP
jgi:hypothetical protein